MNTDPSPNAYDQSILAISREIESRIVSDIANHADELAVELGREERAMSAQDALRHFADALRSSTPVPIAAPVSAPPAPPAPPAPLIARHASPMRERLIMSGLTLSVFIAGLLVGIMLT